MPSRIRLFAALTLLVAVTVFVPLIGMAQIRGAKPAERPGIPVDVELAIAVDISYSMDPEELALQRDGYARALTSTEFLNALRQGIHSLPAAATGAAGGLADGLPAARNLQR